MSETKPARCVWCDGTFYLQTGVMCPHCQQPTAPSAEAAGEPPKLGPCDHCGRGASYDALRAEVDHAVAELRDERARRMLAVEERNQARFERDEALAKVERLRAALSRAFRG